MPTSPLYILPAHRIFKDAKPGIRYYRLMQLLPDIPENTPKQPYLDEMQLILDELGGLLKNAVKLESKGEMGKAVPLYKQLIAAEFDHPYPYLRLCSYYSQRQMPVQVDIVCCCYLKMVQVVSALGFSDPLRNENAYLFIEIASKLEMSADVEEYCERLLTRDSRVDG